MILVICTRSSSKLRVDNDHRKHVTRERVGSKASTKVLTTMLGDICECTLMLGDMCECTLLQCNNEMS